MATFKKLEIRTLDKNGRCIVCYNNFNNRPVKLDKILASLKKVLQICKPNEIKVVLEIDVVPTKTKRN